VYDKLREQLLDDSLLGGQPPAAKKWTREVRQPLQFAVAGAAAVHPASTPSLTWSQMLDYNVPGGKLNRGMAVYDVLAAMKGSEVGQQARTQGAHTSSSGPPPPAPEAAAATCMP
jgi:hypothetical protein